MNMDFRLNKLFFIESLTGNHQQSANDLYNYHISQHFDGPRECGSVDNKEGLFITLREIVKQTATSKVFPLIHIEAHGLDSRKGLMLRSEEIVHWKDLTSIFEEINKNCCNNLVLCISACSSLYVVEEIVQSFYHFGTTTPFFTFVGAEDLITVDDLTTSFPVFYQKFNETKSINESVAEMNLHSNTKFGTNNCHSIFKMCSNKFADTWIKERGTRILQNPDLLNGIYCQLYNYTYGKDCSIEMIYELMLSEKLYVDFFNKRMSDFFMYNCLGNEKRFGTVTRIENFEKCEVYMRRIQ